MRKIKEWREMRRRAKLGLADCSNLTEADLNKLLESVRKSKAPEFVEPIGDGKAKLINDYTEEEALEEIESEQSGLKGITKKLGKLISGE